MQRSLNKWERVGVASSVASTGGAARYLLGIESIPALLGILGVALFVASLSCLVFRRGIAWTRTRSRASQAKPQYKGSSTTP